MAGPTTVRPSKDQVKWLKQLQKNRIKPADVFRLAIDECKAKYKTSDEVRAAVIAKKMAEYGE
jgi:hypothetical protein